MICTPLFTASLPRLLSLRIPRLPAFRVAVLLAALLPLFRAQAGPILLGEPPEAPTPEKIARLRASQGREVRSSPGYPYVVDTANREEARNFFNTVHGRSDGVATQWTGRHDVCLAGTTDPDFRDLVALRINYFRAMAGLPATITLNDAWNAKDQQAALMMAANNSLSHTPPSNWSCYTAEGDEAAGNSNLALGSTGPQAISDYMEDFGGGNYAVGHRRWLLYPQTQTMGTGDVPAISPHLAANALWVFDSNFGGARPATRTPFTAWPPPGYVPYAVVYPRWSFSHPDASFTGATVTVSSNGAELPVTLEASRNNIGEETLVWHLSSLNPQAPYNWPRPAQDTAYSVTVRDVTISGSKRTFTYDVIVFDPAVPTPGRIEPTPNGPAQAAVNQSNSYSFAAVPAATGYQWRASRRAPFTALEGAEEGLRFFTSDTSPGYNAVSTSVKSAGTGSFHLAHPEGDSQSLSSTRTLLPAGNAQVRFRSRLGWATTDQVASFEISPDDGRTWIAVHSQSGTDTQGETSFTTRTASLAAFAGRAIRYRLVYQMTGSSFFPQTSDGIGWYVDDISFSGTEELTAPQTGLVTQGHSFGFIPSQTGEYALDVRAQVYDQFFLEWSPALSVTAIVAPPPPVITIDAAPALANNQFQCDFTVQNFRAGLVLELWKSSGPGGPWSVDAAAAFQTVIPSSRFRVTSPTASELQQFYRIVLR